MAGKGKGASQRAKMSPDRPSGSQGNAGPPHVSLPLWGGGQTGPCSLVGAWVFEPVSEYRTHGRRAGIPEARTLTRPGSEGFAADQADGEPFDLEGCAAGVHDDGLEVRVGGLQLDDGALALQPLDGDIVFDAGNHHLAVTDFTGTVHCEQVAVEDARVAHAHAADLEEIIGAGREQPRVNLIAALHVLGRKDRAAGSNPPDQGQAEGLHEADTPAPGLLRG